jgi:hypothetical protein
MLYVCSKNKQDGYLSPDDFYNTINPAQNEYLDYILGQYQKYQAGRPIAPVEMSQKEKLRQSISPLIYNTRLNPNTTTGIAPFPGDYQSTDAMWTVYGGLYNIRFVSQPRLASFVNSNIDPISNNPVYLLRWEGFEFWPHNIGAADLSYVRNPPAIVWGYVLDSNGVPVWNPATSQDPVWGVTDLMNIVARALQKIGVNLDANGVYKYAEEIKMVG